MTLEHAQLTNLLSGKNDPLWICNIHEGARKEFGCSVGAVYLSGKTAAHILLKHRDITSFDLVLLPIAIMNGDIYRDPEKLNFFGAIYRHEGAKMFFIPMKATESGHQIWVSSMHRIDERQYKQKQARLILISR